jgi:iron(III) transport system permease protein
MTAIAPPRGSRTERKPSPDSRGRAPFALWAIGLLAVVPAIAPIAYLLWSVVRAGVTDTSGISASRLMELFLSTAVLVVAVTATTAVLGTATAWLTTRTDIRGRRMWSTLATLPLVVPSYVGALAMLGSSGNSGLMTEILRTFGLPGLPVFTGFWAAWGALSLWNFSYVHLLAVPAMRRMDPGLEEAARGLGASRWRTVRTVVLPQLRPALLSGSLLVSLYVLSDFGAVSLLRYETFTRAIYAQFRGRLDVTPALFLSGILIVVALVLVWAEQRSRGRANLAARRPTRPPETIRLRALPRLGAYGFLSAVVVGALVLPLLTLVWWTVRGLSLGNTVDTVMPELIRSASVSGVAAVVTVVTAIPLAILTVRHARRATRVLESVTWSAYSLPHLAVGLGFLVLAIRFVPALYQSVPLLIIAYVAMFLPQALTTAQTGLRQIGTSIEEASRGLGSGAIATLRKITLPLLWPSLLAGGALVFLTVMKELPATLLLRPTGFETLAVQIWSASSELFYTQASVAALVLVAVSAVPLYVLVARDLHD